MGKFLTQKAAVILSWVAVLLWMALIFFMSAQVKDESAQLSRGITRMLLELVQGIFPKAEIDPQAFHFFVRKAAHFSVYLILAILSQNAVRLSGLSGLKSLGLALAICVIYAASDEYHQTFVPGRVGTPMDVLIDSAGAITGLLLYFLAGKIFRRKKVPAECGIINCQQNNK